jgi:hypothetical protein
MLNLPTATYDAVNKQISATVIVSYPSLESENATFDTPMIAIPSSVGEEVWTVTWTLVCGANVQLATFKPEKGIDTPENPPIGIADLQSRPVPEQADQWQVSLGNHVEDAANAFKYYINADVKKAGESSSKPFHHDPTIAVVTDPIDGCGKPSYHHHGGH